MCKMGGIGVDLCAIDRMERAIEKEHYTARVFTPQERAYMDARGVGRTQSAAAMFAAKEAVAKALGTGFAQGVMPAQIEVTHDAAGAPGILLHGCAGERLKAAGGGRVLISLSHEGNMAIAFAVIQRDAQNA
ncbi:MAG: holo-ACP synthase [Clostridia bacterium]|nr:holo-ACP synthase [Clostridia bacterium]